MLPNFIRQRISEQVRENLSIALLSQMGKYKWTYWIYSAILCDGYPYGIKFLPNWEFGYNYKGNLVRVPRDAGIVIKESFQENLYGYYPIKRGDVVLDIGAYVGTFALKAAIAVGKRGMIVAVEPDVSNMKYCRLNCKRYNKVKYISKVISDKKGTVRLYLSNGSACHSLVYPHSKSIEVESVTIDGLVEELRLPKVNLIKMDIEGANLMALEGATKTLKRPEVKLALASYNKQPNGEPELPYIIAYLEDRGFQIHQERGYVYAEKIT